MSAPDLRMAYLVMLHQNPSQFQRLFRAIYDPRDYYVVHVDRKAAGQVHRDVAAILREYPNAWILPSMRITWGGWSLMEVQLQAMRRLLAMAADWAFVTNLSGQCFPLQSPERIRRDLAAQPDRNFLHVEDMADWTPGMVRVRWYWAKIPGLPIRRPIRLPIPRRYLADARPYHGATWATLNRAFVEWMTTSPEVERFRRFYRWSVSPDEGFVPSVLMNGPFRKTAAPYRRTIVWTGGSSPKTFTSADLDFLLSSDGWYARKFDTRVDGRILDALEAHVARAPEGTRSEGAVARC
ncbi:MAG: beta-1,6-N-acetylglucosaminyltransferase [Candidatus Rokuibacteriota bacterium]